MDPLTTVAAGITALQINNILSPTTKKLGILTLECIEYISNKLHKKNMNI